jgi:hypothetical protein
VAIRFGGDRKFIRHAYVLSTRRKVWVADGGAPCHDIRSLDPRFVDRQDFATLGRRSGCLDRSVGRHQDWIKVDE